MKRVYSAAEAASELGISKATAIRLYHAGQLKGYRTGTAPNSHIRFYPDSLYLYKKAREQQPGETKSP